MAVLPDDIDRIIQYDTEFIPDVQPFIDDAVVFLTSVIGTGVLSTAAFDMVTKYVAAHFIAVADPRLQSAQVKSLLETYQNKLTPGLGITHYGTVAMTLDTSGKLAAWNTRVVEGKGRVQLFWTGSIS